MIMSILIWLSIILGSLFLILLLLPFRISLKGQADDRKGLSYELGMDWAFGFIFIRLVQGEPVNISVLGFRIWSFSIESWKKGEAEKPPKKKKFSAQAMFQWTKKHLRQIVIILKRFAQAFFLKGYIVGWIGLPDPADTARIGLLCQQLRISKDRFILSVNCVYDREMITINARVQATLIIGYLGLVALRLILEKETRVMIRGLAYS